MLLKQVICHHWFGISAQSMGQTPVYKKWCLDGPAGYKLSISKGIVTECKSPARFFDWVLKPRLDAIVRWSWITYSEVHSQLAPYNRHTQSHDALYVNYFSELILIWRRKKNEHRPTYVCIASFLKGLGLKPLDPFGTEQKKVHRFTNNLQGLQKAMVNDFPRNIIPWNALLFEKTVKQYQFSLARITDLF